MMRPTGFPRTKFENREQLHRRDRGGPRSWQRRKTRNHERPGQTGCGSEKPGRSLTRKMPFAGFAFCAGISGAPAAAPVLSPAESRHDQISHGKLAEDSWMVCILVGRAPYGSADDSAPRVLQGAVGMRLQRLWRAALLLPLVLGFLTAEPARGDGDLKKVKHVIIIMQENHSFDNYFGALAYAPGSPYHNGLGGCRKDDHKCVDGLVCRFGIDGNLSCVNSNPEADGTVVYSFHDPKRCAGTDLDHSWSGTHSELNFLKPNSSLSDPLNDGFVRVNDLTEQKDNG